MSRLSRREFLGYGAILPALSCGTGAWAEQNSDIPALRLAKDLGECEFFAASPDGKLACINVLSDPPKRGRDKWKGPLQIVELSTWRTVFGGQFRGRVWEANFFADGRALFVETYPAARDDQGRIAHQQAIVDLASGAVTDRIHPVVDILRPDYFVATCDRILLAYQKELRKQREDETLALVDFPAGRERIRVSYADRPRDPDPVDRALAFADDRALMAYCFDSIVLCRRTSDLSILWKSQISTDAAMVEVEISARGDRVGIGFTSAASSKRNPGHYIDYITVHDGATGEEVARLPVNDRATAFALSPDGQRIAVAVNVAPGKGVLVPTVNIYEVASGRQVASTVHNRVGPQPHQFLLALCRPTFTADGKYLITDGAGVKVWDLEILRP